MKYGKSLLLGELISATEVDYEDVRKNPFWIVCPVCNEAIFKVVRQIVDSEIDDPHGDGVKIVFGYAADSQLTVGSIGPTGFIMREVMCGLRTSRLDFPTKQAIP